MDEIDKEDEEVLQPKTQMNQTPVITSNLNSRIQALKGGGRPLSESERSFFESRFGHDFSGVSIHTGSHASKTAQSVNARAFTLGTDVVFGAGQYTPETKEGKKLLGHELVHVIQQKSSASSDNYIQREAIYIRSLQPGASSSTGHAFVTVENAQNHRESWGFYANCAAGPLGSRGCTDWELFQMGINVSLPGNVKHETSPSFDDSIRHSLTATQYSTAISTVQALRQSLPDYYLWSYNCVDFVRSIANTVGIRIPDFPGIDEPDELSSYIRQELDVRLLRSGTLSLDRGGSGGSVVNISNNVTGSSNAPHFQINNLPRQHNLRFRWIISDSQNNSYLMWGDSGQVFQYGRQYNAYIGSQTRGLLISRNIRHATIKCRVKAARISRLLPLPVTFTW